MPYSPMQGASLAAALCGALLCGAAAAAPALVRLEGSYTLFRPDGLFDFKAQLRLTRDGRFSYTVPDMSGDILTSCEAAGTVVIEDRWLLLHHKAGPDSEVHCGSITRVYVVEDAPEPLLVPDWALATAVQERKAPDAWRRNGPPRPYTRDMASWLPAPYALYFKAGYARDKPLSGTVVSAGTQRVEHLFAPGNQTRTYRTVVIDIGAVQGAFPGLRVCGPDKQPQRIEQVSARASTIAWTVPVKPGTVVTAPCGR